MGKCVREGYGGHHRPSPPPPRLPFCDVCQVYSSPPPPQPHHRQVCVRIVSHLSSVCLSVRPDTVTYYHQSVCSCVHEREFFLSVLDSSSSSLFFFSFCRIFLCILVNNNTPHPHIVVAPDPEFFRWLSSPCRLYHHLILFLILILLLLRKRVVEDFYYSYVAGYSCFFRSFLVIVLLCLVFLLDMNNDDE